MNVKKANNRTSFQAKVKFLKTLGRLTIDEKAGTVEFRSDLMRNIAQTGRKSKKMTYQSVIRSWFTKEDIISSLYKNVLRKLEVVKYNVANENVR